jgi:hypothetical protein
MSFGGSSFFFTAMNLEKNLPKGLSLFLVLWAPSEAQ